ncbi:hypothetical protein EG829_18455 [bacterium]|nr:hypothetical protein [bacterium]
MDYQFSQEELKLQQDAMSFCREHILVRAGMLDACSYEDACRCMKENLKTLSAGGLLEAGLTGEGLDLVRYYIVGEEIAKICPSTYLSARASAFLCAGAIKLFGTEVQKHKYLPGILKADMIGAFAYSEEQAGTDMAAISTTAECLDGIWRLSGRKDIVVNAPIADVLLVLAACSGDAGAEKGMSLFIVEKGTDGLSITDPVRTMGLRGAPIAGITLNSCKASGILGDEPGRGFMQAKRLLGIGTIGIAALCVGIGTNCMEISTEYAKNRTAFGRRIGMHQDVGFKLADMFAHNDLGRMMALRSAWALNTGEAGAEILAACAKLFASEAAVKIANWGMQIFAGHGYLAGTDMERLYRDAKFGEICEGTSEMQRSFIAKAELDRYVQS